MIPSDHLDNMWRKEWRNKVKKSRESDFDLKLRIGNKTCKTLSAGRYWNLQVSMFFLSFTVWKVFKYGGFSGPQGYDLKRKLFRTNSFVLAHSSAKKFYIEQLTLKSSIQWHHMTLIWRHLVLAVITG